VCRIASLTKLMGGFPTLALFGDEPDRPNEQPVGQAVGAADADRGPKASAADRAAADRAAPATDRVSVSHGPGAPQPRRDAG
jgi:hypothetical protein